MNSSKISFTGKGISIYGGYGIVTSFLKKQGIKKIIDKNWENRKKSPNQIPENKIIYSALASILASKRNLTDFADFSRNWMAEVAGITPQSKSTLSRFFNDLSHKLSIKMEDMITEITHKTLKYHNDKNVVIDYDSSVKTIYGNQEGAAKGYNPQKPGRKSYNMLLAFVSNTQTYLHGTNRPGNCVSLSGIQAFMDESLAKLPTSIKKISMRLDSGFFSAELFFYLMRKNIDFFCSARMTGRIKRLIWAVPNEKWKKLDSTRDITEISYDIGYKNQRKSLRMILVRQKIEDEKNPPQGKLLIDVPGYTFSAIVTNVTWQSPVSIWRFYNKRADMENRIKEIKEDFLPRLSCHSFWANQGLFLMSMFAYELFNLLRKSCLRNRKERHQRFYTFFYKYILIAVKRVKPQGKVHYMLDETYRFKSDFMRLMSLVS